MTAYVRKFINNFRAKWAKESVRQSRKTSGILSVAELEEAEISLVMHSQASMEDPSRLNNLSPFTDELGIVRVGGR